MLLLLPEKLPSTIAMPNSDGELKPVRWKEAKGRFNLVSIKAFLLAGSEQTETPNPSAAGTNTLITFLRLGQGSEHVCVSCTDARLPHSTASIQHPDAVPGSWLLLDERVPWVRHMCSALNTLGLALWHNGLSLHW